MKKKEKREQEIKRLDELKVDYRNTCMLKNDAYKKVVELSEKLYGVSSVKCGVCGTESDSSQKWCVKCGSVLYSDIEKRLFSRDKENAERQRLTAAKRIWDAYLKIGKLNDEISLLKSENERLEQVAKSEKIGSKPIAFLLAEEDGDSDVYMLNKGENVFGSQRCDMENYQRIVSYGNDLKSKHFSLTLTDNDSFLLHTFNDAKVGKNSPTNIVNDVEVFCGDILFIGQMKIMIKDNFNKK